MSVDTEDRSRIDEPVDGLDGAVGFSPGLLWRTIYAFFYNKRFGLILILLTGLLSLFGVLFPQVPAGVRANPESFQAWLATVRGTFGGWTDFMATIGLFNMFSSIPFVIVMVLLALSIIACTTHRVPLLWQTAFHPHTRVTAAFFERARLNAQLNTELSPQAAIEIIEADARKSRVRVIADDRGPGLNLYTDKWHLAPFGTAVAHAAFVVIMAGFLLSSLVGFRNESFALTVDRPQEVGFGTGLVAEAKSFSDTYYDNGTPKDYVSDLVLTRDGQQVARQEVRVNEPLVFEGIMFHQAYFGVSAVMQIRDASGQVIYDGGIPLQYASPDRTINYGVIEVPGRSQELFVIGSASGQTGTGIAPGQMRIEVYPAGQGVPLGTAILDQGGMIEVDGYSYTFEREAQFTGIIVKKDPGAGVVWLGCAMLIIGTCATMFFRHHRIWFRVTEADGGGSLVQFASQDRQDTTFTRRFEELTASLADQLGHSPERTA